MLENISRIPNHYFSVRRPAKDQPMTKEQVIAKDQTIANDKQIVKDQQIAKNIQLLNTSKLQKKTEYCKHIRIPFSDNYPDNCLPLQS